MKRRLALLAPMAVALLAPFTGIPTASAAPGAVPVTTVDVAPISGKAAAATDINNKGTVVGWARINFQTHMIRKTRWGTVEDLGQYSGGDTFADAINERGEIIGHAIGGSSANKRSIAFRWTKAGGYQKIPTPTTARFAFPEDINNRGQAIVNITDSDSPDAGAYLWKRGATTGIKLPDLGHGPAYATSINDDGTIVGYAPTGTVNHVVVWDPDDHAINDLGSGDVDSGAEAINADGTLVGWSGDHAWMWSDDGTDSIDLGHGHALAINSEGVTVGYGTTWSDLTIWDIDYDQVVKLETETTGITEVWAINDRNVIAGEFDYHVATWGPYDPEG